MLSGTGNSGTGRDNIITIGKHETKVFSAGKDPNKIIKKNY